MPEGASRVAAVDGRDYRAGDRCIAHHIHGAGVSKLAESDRRQPIGPTLGNSPQGCAKRHHAALSLLSRHFHRLAVGRRPRASGVSVLFDRGLVDGYAKARAIGDAYKPVDHLKFLVREIVAQWGIRHRVLEKIAGGRRGQRM